MSEKFELGSISQSSSTPASQPTSISQKTSAADPPRAGETQPPVSVSTTELEGFGLHISAGLDAAGYHPVVLFGNANSGKTSLLLSLFALLRTEPSLATGLELGEPLISLENAYGRFLRDQAEAFYGKKTQDFIEGVASPKTAIEMPFFIPVVIRPDGKPEIRLAFMESNGEWYRPDRSSDRLFPSLRRQIEDFLAVHQGPITFIHLLPYTQQAVYGSNVDQLTDANEMQEASLAIVGALFAYQKVRPNKQDDRHLMLVTKWDAHDRKESDRAYILLDPADEPETFASERYPQAMAAFRGLGLQTHQQQINAYCAGIIAGQCVSMPKHDSELRAAVIAYPTHLWRWLYRTALFQMGERPADPFPEEPKANWLVRLLDRLF